MIAAKERRPAGRPGKNRRTHTTPGTGRPIESELGTKSSCSGGQVEPQLPRGVDAEAPPKRVIAAAHRPSLHVAVELPVPAAGEVRLLYGARRLDRRQRDFVRQKVPPHANRPVPQPQGLEAPGRLDG